MNFSNAEGKPEEGEEVIAALILARGLALPFVLKSVVELNIFDIMVAAGDDAWLSASDMASQLPTNNPDTAAMLDRMLGLLACYSIVKSKVETGEDVAEVDGQERRRLGRLYGVTPISKLFTIDEEQSVGPFLTLLHDKRSIQTWCQLTNSVLHGGTPFVHAHGMTLYKYKQEDQELNQLFNKAMYNQTAITMRKIVDTYKGFERLGTLVDVGGGSGAALSIITSKYPNIKGINFDLPEVVKKSPTYSANIGVEHVSGDMFERVPSGDAIFLKSVLHNWDDEHCIKLLKNCNHALPDDNGFVIIVEAILPMVPDTQVMSIFAHYQDVGMLFAQVGGKERTLQEYEALSHKSGFYCCNVMGNACGFYVMELHKKAD